MQQRKAIVQARGEMPKRSVEVWLNELIWREFYIQILFHFPHVSQTAFNASLANIEWINVEVAVRSLEGGQDRRTHSRCGDAPTEGNRLDA